VSRARPAPRRPGRARPRSDVERSKDRIHGAALALLARYGYEGVSLQQIADAVGLHKSSLFHHYRGKLELAKEVFEAVMHRVAERMRPLEGDDPPRLETLLSVTDALVDHFADEPAAARLILSVMIAPRDSDLNYPISLEDVDHPVVRVQTLLWSWLERARRAGAIRPANLRQALFNLFGVTLLYPAVADEHSVVAGPAPFSEKARRVRKQELRLLLRGALEPR
jgi:TetR/AcrR family transcriptional regulator